MHVVLANRQVTNLNTVQMFTILKHCLHWSSSLEQLFFLIYNTENTQETVSPFLLGSWNSLTVQSMGLAAHGLLFNEIKPLTIGGGSCCPS